MYARRLASRLYSVSVFLAIAVPATLAQNPGTGGYTYSNSDSFGFDSINPGNLNVHFAVPIVNKQGRGLPFQYSLVFDSLIWTPVGSVGSQVWTPDASFGLHGYLLNDGYKGFLSYTSTPKKCFDDPNNPGNWEWLPIQSAYVYHDEFGALHAFNYSYNVCTGVTTGNGSTSDESGFSFDGSNVHSRSGQALNLPTYVNGAVASTTGTITDSNGNQVINNQNGTFTDTTGLTPLTITGSGTVSSPRVFTYRTTTGTATVTLSYLTYSVQTNFSCSGVSQYGSKFVDLPDTITLADGSTYKFGYEATPGVSGHVTGRLASITLPTGGKITYAYSGGSGGIVCSDGTTAGLTRSDSISTDGSTGYVRSAITSTHSHTEVTGPHGDQTEIDYALSGGVPYETTRSVHSGNSSGPQLAKTDTCYNGVVPPNCTNQSLTLPVTQLSIYRTLGTVENGFDMHFNTSGLTTDVEEYGYGTSGSNVRGSALRKTVYSYAILGGYLVDRVAEVDVYDGPGTTLYSKTTYSYDTIGATPTSGLPNHVSVSGPRGNLQGVQSWFNSGGGLSYWSIGVDDAGQPYVLGDPKGNGTNYYYDATDTFLTKVVQQTTSNGVQHISQSTYDANSGLITSAIDQNSQTTSYHYDNMLRATETDFPDGGKTTWTYSPTSTIAKVLQQGVTTLNSETDVDAIGRTSKTITPDGSFTTYTYAPQQLQNCVSNPQPSGATSGAVYSCSTYDALGRVVGRSDADGSSSSVVYTDATQTPSDEAGRKRQLAYDGLGRLAQVGEPDTSSTFNWVTAYSYDPADRLLQIQQKGGSSSSSQWRTRTFTYDLAGRMLTRTEPESGLTTWTYTSGTTLCSGDPNLPCTKTDARAVTSTYSYDALNRPSMVSYSDGITPYIFYSYDAPPGWMPDLQNTIGRRTNSGNQYAGGTSGQATATTYSYDAMGRVIRQWEQTPSVSAGGDFVYSSYNLAGSLTSTTTAAGTTISYAYDTVGRLSSVTSSLNDAQHPSPLYSVDSAVGYYPSGDLRKASFGNGLTQSLALNSQLQPCRVNVNSSSAYFSSCADAVPSGNVLDFTVGYNAGSVDNGNVTTWSATGQQVFTRSYGYDSLNRIQSMTDSASAQSCKGLSWTLDVWGNVTAQTTTAGTCYSLQVTADTSNRLSGNQYDAAGNLTNDTTHQYTYDGESRLIKVDSGNTATYVYNENGERVRKATPGGWTEYFYGPNGMVQSEYNGSSWPAQYVYAGGQLIAEYANGTTEFMHSDHLGSTRLVTGMSRQVLDNLDYLPFGRQVAGGSTSTHKFTGLELDAETNQDHTPFRQYGPVQARWTSPDPYMGSYDLTNPQSLNRYAYVGNNPLSLVDPSGLMACQTGRDGRCGGTDPGDGGGSGGWDPSDDCQIYGFCGCDPIFADCGGGGGVPGGPPPSPSFSGKYKNLDPNQVWTEQLGLPAGMKLSSGGILDIFGVDTGCEFGACGMGPSAYGPGSGAIALGGATGICVLAEPCGAVEAIGGLILGADLLYQLYQAHQAGKENIRPSWAEKYGLPRPGESGNQFADRVCKAEYGPSGCPGGTGPGSDYNKLKKWADRRGK